MDGPRISLVCVGSELLRGKINTHASTLARRLSGLGLHLSDEQTVSDDLPHLTRVISKALLTRDIVFVTGGLGPTFDDVTREAVSAASGRPLVLSQLLLRGIRAKFKRARLRNMPPANARQAYLLSGARAIPNSVGTAPGQWLDWRGPHRCVLILLPGPPSELNPMLETHVLPRLKKEFPQGARAEAHLHFVNVPESHVDHRVRPIVARESGADFTILAQPGLVDLDVFVTGGTQKIVKARLSRIVKAIKTKTRSSFYGMDPEHPLERVVMNGFLSARETLAVAESCTGGELSKKLTDIPGSSSYFLGSVTSYSNTAKNSLLDVPETMIRAHGAVSAPVAQAMADGTRARFGSDWAISITGVAGPDGGTSKKPVGLVFMALSSARTRKTYRFQFAGNRSRIRFRATVAALDLLRRVHG